jgi:transcriptional regulator with XRE-family HTH domain
MCGVKGMYTKKGRNPVTFAKDIPKMNTARLRRSSNWINEEIGANIKRLRKQRGLTAKNFAELIGYGDPASHCGGTTAVNKIERGAGCTTINRLYVICCVLNCSFDDIMPRPKYIDIYENVEIVKVVKKYALADIVSKMDLIKTE